MSVLTKAMNNLYINNTIHIISLLLLLVRTRFRFTYDTYYDITHPQPAAVSTSGAISGGGSENSLGK